MKIIERKNYLESLQNVRNIEPTLASRSCNLNWTNMY